MMHLISYNDFYNLKLEDFILNKEEIEIFPQYIFLSSIWDAEMIDFTAFLTLCSEEKIKAISLDLKNLSDESIHQILNTLKLNLSKGTTKDEIYNLLGQPKKISKYKEDRLIFEYIIGSAEKYYLQLTTEENAGLSYLMFTNHTKSINELA